MRLIFQPVILIAFPLAFCIANPVSEHSPKRLLLLCQSDGGTALWVDSMHQTLERIGDKIGFEVALKKDGSMFERVEDLRSFEVIVSTDVAIESILTEKQKRVFENYMLGSAQYSGGKYLRLGKGESRETSRSGEEEGMIWSWYHELVEPDKDQDWRWESPDEWEEANLPALEVHGTNTQAIGHLKTASSSRVLPHPFPGEHKQGGYVFSTLLGGNIESYSRNKRGQEENPVFIQHLEEALSWITGYHDDVPADIQLLDFSAIPNLDRVALSWLTVWEEENDHFEVERALSGVPWHTLDAVKAVGNSPESSRYEYWDLDVHPGQYYYRIKQVDKKGNVNYSDMVVVQIGIDQPGIDIYPNPVRETLFVSVVLKEMIDFSYQIEDREGRMIQRQKVEAVMANQASSIDLSHLVPGIYQLRLMVPEGDVIKTFIKY
ncbi:MAG: T9SS type A sorting domain-containing protein [Bacteroidota bacterium]